MSRSRHQKERNSKRRIAWRLRERHWKEQHQPMLQASNIHYDISDRMRALGPGGIGAIHLLVRRVGLIEEIDRELHLLKRHLPYFESDHVLNIAYNLLSGGTCLEDIELLRNDENYLDALGTQRIPDPTTEGDFCRRFETTEQVGALQSALNRVRMRVWKMQPKEFHKEAIIEADGTLAPTTGECKEGMDISHKGEWGYHPLLVSLANTGEPLYFVNRPGNRPSHEGAAACFDQSIDLCRAGGFAQILLRGDTDFSQTKHLDRWNREAGVRFIFGMDANPKLVKTAWNLDSCEWRRLHRPRKYRIKTRRRKRADRVKERIVKERRFENIRLRSEDVAEFAYRPDACKEIYRVVVVRKNLTIERGEEALFDDVRYFFYITNDWKAAASTIVFLANDRCNQENLIEQLKNGVRALRMPVDGLLSNWAYMVMASLAWTLKAWFALLLPEAGRWSAKYREEKQAIIRMEFRTFVNAFIRIPCQIVRGGRHIVFRLLSWNPWQKVFLRGVDALRAPLRC